MADTAAGRLGRLLAPASIAIVGASANPDRIGSRVLTNLRRHGYPGQVSVINSRYQEVAGLASYPSLAALDQLQLNEKDTVVLCLSGRGDKDMATYMNAMEAGLAP